MTRAQRGRQRLTLVSPQNPEPSDPRDPEGLVVVGVLCKRGGKRPEGLLTQVGLTHVTEQHLIPWAVLPAYCRQMATHLARWQGMTWPTPEPDPEQLTLPLETPGDPAEGTPDFVG